MRDKQKKEMIMDFAKNQLIPYGFRVFVSDKPEWQTYAFFVIDNKIGYVQIDDLTGEFVFSTVHKPNRVCGTGFRYTEKAKPFAKTAENCADCIAPPWASKDRPHVKKFRDWDEFAAQERVLKYVEIT